MGTPSETEFLCASLYHTWLVNEKNRRNLPDDGKVYLCRYTENGDVFDREDVTESDIPSKIAFALYNSQGLGVTAIGIEFSDQKPIGKIEI